MANEKKIAETIAIEIVAARGQQVRRKDKDLMRDTGGVSKGRDNEPNFKPPRDDVKGRYRDKRMAPSDRDKDTNADKDREVKTPNRNACHPLDVEVDGGFGGFKVPEENYHRKVFHALWRIIEDANRVSEKDFAGQDDIRDMCDKVIRDAMAERIIQRFSEKSKRPEYCAESVYDQLVAGK